MYDKGNVGLVKIDDELMKLIRAVEQVTSDFIANKGTMPTRVFLSTEDFNVYGEVIICGYKVITTNMLPKGSAYVMNDEPLTVFDIEPNIKSPLPIRGRKINMTEMRMENF